ncbi:MAG: DUF1446 domain-containing protein [SAR202 cluster bacterium]|nr:DUF1446 domain-containing protein [SAR202 cluster bacterium]
MTSVKILCPTGHLGFTPLEKDSFLEGCSHEPDFIIADSGSCDIGPYPLGSNGQASPEDWQRGDLEVILLQARRLGIPMIIGSASDTGTNRGVDRYARMIQEIAAQHGLPPFKMATIYSDLPVDDLRTRLRRGDIIEGLNGRPKADEAVLDRTDRAVAMMGAEPIQVALSAGADVVICGRSCDCVLFAAPLLNAQFDPGVSNLTGKILECASLCAEPFMAKESVLARVEGDAVHVAPINSAQRCTPASIASHLMYERTSPFREYVAGGYVDMSDVAFDQVDERTTKVVGARFFRSEIYKVKVEGAGKVGERRLYILGIGDPDTIAHVDRAIDWVKQTLVTQFGPEGERYQIFYHLYGRGAVMGEFDQAPEMHPHELGVVVEVVAQDAEEAERICTLGARNLFFARLGDVKGTAGAVALMADEVLVGHPGYEWTLNHLIAVGDPLELFPIRYTDVHAQTSGEVV